MATASGGGDASGLTPNDMYIAKVLVLAAKNGFWDTVWTILKHKPYLINYIPEERSWGLLHQACYWENEEAVVRLLNNPYCDPHLLTKNGLRANDITRTSRLKRLIEAAQGGGDKGVKPDEPHSLEQMKQDLGNKIKANEKNIQQLEKFFEAEPGKVITTIVETAKQLVNVVFKAFGMSILHKAAQMNSLQFVTEILDTPACDPSVVTKEAPKNPHGPGKTAEFFTTNEAVKVKLSWKIQQLKEEHFKCPTFVLKVDCNLILMRYTCPTIERHIETICKKGFDSEMFYIFSEMIADVFNFVNIDDNWERAKIVLNSEFVDNDHAKVQCDKGINTQKAFYEYLIKLYTRDVVYSKVNQEIRNQAISIIGPKLQNLFVVYASLLNAILFEFKALPAYTKTTYRGMRKVPLEVVQEYSVGKEFGWLNFVSSTSEKKEAESFTKKDAEKLIFEIDNTTECSWSPKAIFELSAYAKEKEYIYPCGAQFRVTGVSPDDSRYIYLELVDTQGTVLPIDGQIEELDLNKQGIHDKPKNLEVKESLFAKVDS